MPLGTLGQDLGPYWGYIAPVEKTNLLTNPSFERGTAGWAAYGPAGSAVVGTTADVQAFGAWCGSIATQSTSGTAGAVSPSFTSSNGSAYTVSAYIRGKAAVSYILGVGDSSGNNLIGSVAFTQPGGAGTWHRYSFSYTEAVGATRAVVVRKTADPTGSPNTIYIDGAQVELGSITTYLDGDQDGCQWLGGPHASQSYRSGQARAGGSVIALADIGLYVDESLGVGMPPLENSYQSYAIIDGAQYQRTRAGVRSFTLSANPISGTSHQDYHTVRRRIVNAFKIDAVTPQQPTRFWYIGAGGTVQIDGVLDEGLQGGQNDGFTEQVGVRFLAFDPYFESTTQQGTALAARVNLGSTNHVVKRSSSGQWGTLGVNGTTFNGGSPIVNASIITNNGDVFFGGVWGSAGGTQSPAIARYSPTTNTFGSLTGGTIQSVGVVFSLALSPAGTLYVGGNFTLAGGTTISHVAQWNGGWGSLPGGTISSNSSHIVNALQYSRQGTLFMGGTFTSVGGTTTKSIGFWNGAAAGTLSGTVQGEIYTIAEGLDGRIFVGGDFTTAGGTTAVSIAQWNGAWGSLSGGTLADPLGPVVQSLSVGPNGVLYIGGGFVTIGAGSYFSLAQWNGAGFTPMGSGLILASLGGGFIYVVSANQNTGAVDAGGYFNTANGVPLNDGYAQWNGYNWLSQDIDLPNNGTVITIARGLDNTTYIAGQFSGTSTAASVTNVVNSGMAQAYPTIVFNNNSSGTARLTRMVNTTTGDAIYFNLALLAQERATLTLTPGDRSFTSSARGNLFGYIYPGSNLASWRLLPGTNTITLYADNDSLQTSIYWTPRHWSADGTFIP